MMHYREDEIARLAARGEENDAHLRGCAECRGKYLFLRAMHHAFLEESRRPPDRRLAPPVPGPGGPILLKPYLPPVELPGGGRGQHLTLLSAQADTSIGETHVRAAVFAAEEQGVLVRVVQEDDGAVRCYVLTDDDRKRKHVLLAVVAPAGDRLLMATDEEGVASGEVREPVSWHEASMMLYLPLAVLRPEDRPAGDSPWSASGVTVEARTHAGRLRLQCSGTGGSEPRRLLVEYADGDTETIELAAGAAEISAKTLAAIRVFP